MDKGPERSELNIVLVAEEGAGLRMLKELEAGPHRVAMVLTSPPDVPGSAVWAYGASRGHRLLPASAVRDPTFVEAVRAERIDLLLNVHSLYVLASPLIEAPRLGSYNLHPGPLPRYAGMMAPAWAIHRGERRHGVTVHRMLAGIDTGPIAFQTTFDLSDEDTALSVGVRCVEEGVRLMCALVAAASTGPAGIPRIEQDLSRREYFGKKPPDSGIVRWDRSEIEVDRFVRAFCYHPFPAPWGHPKTTLRGRELSIVKTSRTREAATAPPGTVAFGPDNDVRVACADAWLRMDVVKLDGARVVAGEVLVPGDRLGE